MALIRELDVGTKNLETDLKNNKVPMSEEDKFLDVMSVSLSAASAVLAG